MSSKTTFKPEAKVNLADTWKTFKSNANSTPASLPPDIDWGIHCRRVEAQGE